MATSIDASCFLLLLALLPGKPTLCAMFGGCVGGMFAFFSNRHWSFQAAAGRLTAQSSRWLLVWFGSVTLNSWLTVALLDAGAQPSLARIATAMAVGLGFNFPLHRHFVFGEAGRDS